MSGNNFKFQNNGMKEDEGEARNLTTEGKKSRESGEVMKFRASGRKRGRQGVKRCSSVSAEGGKGPLLATFNFPVNTVEDEQDTRNCDQT